MTTSHSRKKKQTKRHRHTIALLYHSIQEDSDLSYENADNRRIDEDTEITVNEIKQSLKKHRLNVQIVKLYEHDISAINSIRADYIFNLVDSKSMELKIAAILDRLDIPFSGSPIAAIRNGNNKIRSKIIFTKYHIPTPNFSIIEPGAKITRSVIPGKFPLIVKPAFEHGSVGISDRSVISNFRQLQSSIQATRKKVKQTLLCESFIKGKEIQITVLEQPGGTIALPPAEMVFRGKHTSKWNIYGYTEKWRKNRRNYKNCEFIAPPRSVPPSILQKMQRDAIRAFYAFGLKDYARFDIRYHTKTKQWYFLEGNPNPGLSTIPEDAEMTSIRASDMTFDGFILTIIRNTLPDV